MIRIGILTSSRADYGIYLPLIKALNNDRHFEIKLIVFGTHLSKYHGYTIEQIEDDGFSIFKKIESFQLGDSPNSISTSYSITAIKFTEFWEESKNDFDLFFALGDRFEMAAAVASSIPYQIKFAHLHGGETTLGAIDNIYRHFISISSVFHFVSTYEAKFRLQRLLDFNQDNIHVIGSLSLENLEFVEILSIDLFKELWNIDLTLGTILVTIHPETIDFEQNVQYASEIANSLEELCKSFQIIITMPNADTNGLLFRDSFERLAKKCSNIYIIENFGTQSYFTCMNYARLLIGNTSSGIIEAASFKKFVLNIGNRQKGRVKGENVINLPFSKEEIVSNANKYAGMDFLGENPYYKEKPSGLILEILKNYYGISQ